MSDWPKDGEENKVQLTEQAIEALDRLFRSVAPLDLREHLIEVYHSYLICAHDALPLNFHEISTSMYLLINCLNEMGPQRGANTS